MKLMDQLPIRGLSFISCIFISTTAFAQSNQVGGALNQKSGEYAVPAGGLEGAVPKTTIIKQEAAAVSRPANINTENASMADFQSFEKSCKGGDGNACLVAAKIMMAEKPPQEIFNLSSTTRINRGIRLYEAAIAANNNLEAMELVYDLYYDKNIIERQLHSYTDKDRANELLEIMVSKNYPGGTIRQAREYIEDPQYLLSFSKKKEACATARALSTQNDLTLSTKSIVNDLLSGNICPLSK
jgi:hypothetical protein